MLSWNELAPRLGIAFDLIGEGTTVVKAYYGRFLVNLAQKFQQAYPGAVTFEQYEFLDTNPNRLFDGPNELGGLVARLESGANAVNSELEASYTDEFNLSFEREIVTDASVRLSYVRKSLKDIFGLWNRAQELPLRTSGVPCGDASFPCPPSPSVGFLSLIRVPSSAAFAQEQIYDTFPEGEADYDVVQLAAERRFDGIFFVRGSFDYQWREEVRQASAESLSPSTSDPIRVSSGGGAFFQNHHRDVSLLQKTADWQARLLARYQFPLEVGLSVSLRHQSGWSWAPIHRVRIPGSGTQPFFLEELRFRRSDKVTLLDLRLEKAFLYGDRHRVTAMLDLYNLGNTNAEINFVMRTGDDFQNVIAALDPRTLKIGLRWQF